MITNRTTEGGSQTAEASYVYDSLDRLLSESHSTSNLPPSTTSFSYDLAGNRLTKTVDGLGIAYTLGTGNRLTSAGTVGVIVVEGSSSEPIGTNNCWGELWVSNITAQVGWVPEIDGSDFLLENLPVAPGTNLIVAAIRDQAGNTDYTTNTVVLSATNQTQTFAYNTAGCMTNLNGISIEWDERYRLTEIYHAEAQSTQSVAYAYDVLGRRTSRTDGSATNYYIYNGNQVVADLDSSGTLLRTYVWGPGIDNLLSITLHQTTNSQPQTLFAIKNHQNSVIALADENGAVVESYEYDAWGNVTVFDDSGSTLISDIGLPTSGIGNRYTFQGREIDWDTGLIYFRARWYDPETGRWLSKDPLGISGGLNLYAFCGNNPVMFIDPFGLCQEDIDKLRDAFNKQLEQWIKDGKRLPGQGEFNGWLNNALSGIFGYMGCWEQASQMKIHLVTSVETGDIWQFNEIGTEGLAEHHWLEAENLTDPDAPTLYIDPWAGDFHEM